MIGLYSCHSRVDEKHVGGPRCPLHSHAPVDAPRVVRTNVLQGRRDLFSGLSALIRQRGLVFTRLLCVFKAEIICCAFLCVCVFLCVRVCSLYRFQLSMHTYLCPRSGACGCASCALVSRCSPFQCVPETSLRGGRTRQRVRARCGRT